MLAAVALAAALTHTRDAYLADIASFAKLTGRDVAYDYVFRLDADIDALAKPTPYATSIATLDNDVVSQLVARTPRSLATIRGLGETLVRSSGDGTLQPIAAYVPAGYDPAHPAPLVVFLHGSGGTESQLLSWTEVAHLADSTGSIVIAPYGRGYQGFRHAAASDVYDALAAAKSAFSIDPRKQYLAGYSMGGFSVFEIGVAHPSEWAALMCISGGLSNRSDAIAAARDLRGIPLYALTGKNDPVIPTEFATRSAGFLSFSGEPVSYYQQPDGTHQLDTLAPIVDQAWSDMHHGVLRQPPPDAAFDSTPPQLVSGG